MSTTGHSPVRVRQTVGRCSSDGQSAAGSNQAILRHRTPGHGTRHRRRTQVPANGHAFRRLGNLEQQAACFPRRANPARWPPECPVRIIHGSVQRPRPSGHATRIMRRVWQAWGMAVGVRAIPAFRRRDVPKLGLLLGRPSPAVRRADPGRWVVPALHWRPPRLLGNRPDDNPGSRSTPEGAVEPGSRSCTRRFVL